MAKRVLYILYLIIYGYLIKIQALFFTKIVKYIKQYTFIKQNILFDLSLQSSMAIFFFENSSILDFTFLLLILFKLNVIVFKFGEIVHD